MSATLHRIQLRADLDGIGRWQEREGILPLEAGREVAFHHLLTETFGSRAPRPFRVLNSGIIDAYTITSAEELREVARETAMPEQYKLLGVDEIAGKLMPAQWTAGRLLSFEAKVMPLVRAKNGEGKQMERDFYRYANKEVPKDRRAAYALWFTKQVNKLGGAEILQVATRAMGPVSIIRKKGQKPWKSPFAFIEGILQVRDNEDFNRLLKRGVGRHVTYGYGMVRIKPH